MLATLGTAADVRGKGWWYEMKWDGIRCSATVTGDGVRLTSRSGRDMTAEYPELAALREAVDPETLARGPVVLDGEIVALDDADRPSFARLQQRIGVRDSREVARLRQEVPVDLMLFDVLTSGGDSLLRTHLVDRRAELERVVTPSGPVHVPPVHDGEADDAIAVSRELGLEGIVAKKTSSTYLPGRRAGTWVKVKHATHQEVVVIGWRHGKGGRAGGIGSLLVAVPDSEGALRYAGRVGTGFSAKDLADLGRAFADQELDAPVTEGVPAEDRRDAQWVQPELVGEVEHAGRTDGGRLRHPVWRGWRTDIGPEDVRWEGTMEA